MVLITFDIVFRITWPKPSDTKGINVDLDTTITIVFLISAIKVWSRFVVLRNPYNTAMISHMRHVVWIQLFRLASKKIFNICIRFLNLNILRESSRALHLSVWCLVPYVKI